MQCIYFFRDRTTAGRPSTDGKRWQMIRLFRLELGAAAATVGFAAQSPIGDGCAVRFDEIGFSRDRLAELRDGS